MEQLQVRLISSYFIDFTVINYYKNISDKNEFLTDFSEIYHVMLPLYQTCTAGIKTWITTFPKLIGLQGKGPDVGKNN